MADESTLVNDEGGGQAAPLQVGYYAATMGIPARALETLKGHGRPTGDTGDWPLDDRRVTQFVDALQVRKRITGAVNLYRGLMGLAILGMAIMVVVMATSWITMDRRGAQGAVFAMASGSGVVFWVGFGVLYFFAARGTKRSQRWATLTMFIIFIALGIVQLPVICFGIGAHSRDVTPAIVGFFCLILNVVFAVVSWRGFSATAKYLTQPAWCQELIAKAGL